MRSSMCSNATAFAALYAQRLTPMRDIPRSIIVRLFVPLTTTTK